jgi:trigger factor
MDIPGATGVPDREALQKAEEESERLLDELKKEVRAEVRDIGVLRKELSITVPAKIIADHMEHNYAELVHDAFVPGFRKGRAPRRLIEKRYGAEVRQSLTSSMVAQSFFAAVDKESLDVLGDPLLSITTDAGTKLMDVDEALQHLKLPETGDFSYVCEIELKPKFELPELKGIPVKTPPVEVTDAMVAEQILQRRTMRGRLEPVTDGPAERDDLVIADVVLTVDGQEVKHEENVTVGVRPTRLEGIALHTLDQVLAGVTPGATRTAECNIPDDFERPDLRGKAGQFEFKVHELKRLVPEPLPEFLQAWGFDQEGEARRHFRQELEAERDQRVEQAKKTQVEQYLLQHTTLDLPLDFSTRQTERAVMRRVIELQQRGVPPTDIEARIDALRTSAKEQVANDLKLGFIFEKVAEQIEVEVTDEEVNTEIARMARLYNRRFDRIRDELQARGLLAQLVEQIRQNKCVDWLLTQAKPEDAVADAAEAQPRAARRRRRRQPEEKS